jgi:hypothetical protein
VDAHTIHRLLFDQERATTACGLSIEAYYPQKGTARLIVTGRLIGCSHEQSKVFGCQACLGAT